MTVLPFKRRAPARPVEVKCGNPKCKVMVRPRHALREGDKVYHDYACAQQDQPEHCKRTMFNMRGMNPV